MMVVCRDIRCSGAGVDVFMKHETANELMRCCEKVVFPIDSSDHEHDSLAAKGLLLIVVTCIRE